MGQKVNPHGLRVGVIKNWDSRWFVGKDTFGDTLVEDKKIRDYLKKTLYGAGVPRDDALVSTEPAWITGNQLEAARITMPRYTPRGGKVWIKIFPDKPVTEKPAETRMGSGKGSPEYWVAVVKPGRILFEMSGITEEAAREAMRLASHKLPVKCKFIKRETAKETGGEA